MKLCSACLLGIKCRIKRRREKEKTIEQKKETFRCLHCGEMVAVHELMGTKHRNHCPSCLWSKHVDLEMSGDRKSECGGGMEPIGLTFKHEGYDKYGKLKRGEIMMVHRCASCGDISINRAAADDSESSILQIFESSKNASIDEETLGRLNKDDIKILSTHDDEKEIKMQLFGEKKEQE